ncbi:axial regulator YABBY 4 isoform X2 [Vigna radiata var. radiata]|uniref:Axial regulator YABBY 4 isoform X2 n=1 Tax=Vigna radiata var. radiata TaxID=3916 RepID=A0A1S3VQS7_VIGRR|nr:axial regulator YABBY 4 isoform X2 [Vigna radiata var. radiata]
MSTLNHLFDLPEQICYVQCGFCTTILMVMDSFVTSTAPLKFIICLYFLTSLVEFISLFLFNSTEMQVSVPCSSLSMVVTVRCGHCTSLLSVNMMKASFVPFHLLASLSHLEPKESSPEQDANRTLNSHSASLMTYSDCEEEDLIPMSNIVNKPPEKRQRTPSAYNCFIKEEIKRLKAENPDMAHKEAFSTAAKNVSGPIFPQLSAKEMIKRAVARQINLWILTPKWTLLMLR